MDTDYIIQQTLRLHQMRIDSRMRARTILEWRQATQTSVRDQIAAFRNTFLRTGGVSGMLGSGAYNTVISEVTGKNAGAVSVSANTGATLGAIRIDRIVSLAKGANLTSTQRASTTGQGFSMNARIDSLSLVNGAINFSNYEAQSGEFTITRAAVQGITSGAWGPATSEFKVGDNTVTLTKAGGGVVNYTIKDGDGNVSAPAALSFDSEGIAKITVEGEEIEITRDGADLKVGSQTLQFFQSADVMATNGTVVQVQRLEGETDPLNVFHNGARLNFVGEAQITVDGESITLKSDMTINSMIAHVNSQLADAGKDIKMSYDGRTDRFSLESTTIGGASFTASGQALTAFSMGTTAVAGTRAEMVVTINGITDTIFSDTNTFNMGGALITVNNTTQVGDDPINVAIKRDTTDALARIKSFIDAYNAIIQRIESLVRERKSPNEVSYGPLTDEEKSNMTDKQIADWEAIARKGILRNDQGLQNLANSLRRELFVSVEAAGLSPQAIGLSTARYDAKMGGQIDVDYDKLKAALEDDPDKVFKIFASTEGNSGLLWRMDELMGRFVNSSQPRTIKNLEESIRKANEQMAKMQERMYAEEDRLYRQFAAMETALSKMQQQGDWFSSMLSGLQKK